MISDRIRRATKLLERLSGADGVHAAIAVNTGRDGQLTAATSVAGPMSDREEREPESDVDARDGR